MILKKYIEVIAKFNTEGEIVPLVIIWEDGHKFEIDRILDIRPAASLKAGGAGIRYTCRICGKQRFLFLEESRWFVEQELSDVYFKNGNEQPIT